VLQTCIGLKEAGFDPVLVVDAIASRRESDKQAALWRAVQEGILLTTTESLLFELTVDSNNPKFREISRLVK
jgi:nicotinamidase-related amidase